MYKRLDMGWGVVLCLSPGLAGLGQHACSAETVAAHTTMQPSSLACSLALCLSADPSPSLLPSLPGLPPLFPLDPPALWPEDFCPGLLPAAGAEPTGDIHPDQGETGTAAIGVCPSFHHEHVVLCLLAS